MSIFKFQISKLELKNEEEKNDNNNTNRNMYAVQKYTDHHVWNEQLD